MRLKIWSCSHTPRKGSNLESYRIMRVNETKNVSLLLTLYDF